MYIELLFLSMTTKFKTVYFIYAIKKNGFKYITKTFSKEEAEELNKLFKTIYKNTKIIEFSRDELENLNYI